MSRQAKWSRAFLRYIVLCKFLFRTDCYATGYFVVRNGEVKIAKRKWKKKEEKSVIYKRGKLTNKLSRIYRHLCFYKKICNLNKRFLLLKKIFLLQKINCNRKMKKIFALTIIYLIKLDLVIQSISSLRGDS